LFATLRIEAFMVEKALHEKPHTKAELRGLGDLGYADPQSQELSLSTLITQNKISRTATQIKSPSEEERQRNGYVTSTQLGQQNMFSNS
jgi:hypothetical protein